MTEGRINIHLHEYKEKLQLLHPGYGELSRIVRALVESYLEGRIMHLSPNISKLLEQGKDDEAIELLTNDLVLLRQRRAQVGMKASKTRSQKKSQQAKDKAGVKTPERQRAEQMVEDMLKMQAETTTIEFGDDNGLERADSGKEETSPNYGVAKKVS